MTIRKAVIPAAGFGTRMLPATRSVRKELFPIVDVDGLVKPAIQIIVEEAVASGIEDIAIVVAPGGDAVFRAYFSDPPQTLRKALEGKPAVEDALDHVASLGRRIVYITQPVQDGYGDAVRCARDWAGDDPVLVMLGDHVYLSGESRRCARQLIEAFEQVQSPASGVIRKPPAELNRFGAISGERHASDERLYHVHDIVEKPDVGYARQHLRIDGLPEDTYLCFFGLHAMTPDIFDILERMKTENRRERGEIQLTTGQAILARQRSYYALEIAGDHYDIGVPDGYARTVQAFAESRA